MKVGIIGLGNIGKMLAERFAEFLSSSDIIVFDLRKINGKKYSRANSVQETVDKSDIVFLCVRPQDIKSLFAEIKQKNKIFVTAIAAIYENTYYEKLGRIKLIRIIPSMLNKIGGPILLLAGKYTNKFDQNKVKTLLAKIGNIHEIKESEIDAYTHLSSCLPAIVAEFLKLYTSSLMEEKKINKQKASEVLNEMLEIFVPLLKKEGFKVIPQVCTKGGVTEQGIKIMERYKNSFFKDLTSSLLKKMSEARKQYGK